MSALAVRAEGVGKRYVKFHDAPMLTHALISVTPLAVAAAYFYSTMHYVVTPAVLAWARCAAPKASLT